jgi:hypothetical protein
MEGDQPISWLMFFTLAAVIVVGAGVFLNFLRSRHNREIAAVALEGNNRSGPGMTPSGALPELVGLFVLALVAMGLLTAGYQSHSAAHFAAGSATPVPTAPSNRDRGTTVGAGATVTPPEAPTKDQPSNPAPDVRNAPTSSPTGAGPESGGHPEAK